MGKEQNTQGARLRQARIDAGFRTAKDAAKAVGMNPVSYRALENDQHKLNTHAAILARRFGVSAGWLIDGADDGVLAGEPERAIAADPFAGKEIEMVRKVDITYAMGSGSIIEDYPDVDFLPFSLGFLRQFSRSTTDKLFLATGYGDSMEPTLRRDDLVMIDTAQNRIGLTDQIWALTYAGAGMIKRLRPLSGGKILILSDNQNVPPQEVSQDEIYIVGKVVWAARVM